MQSVSVSNVRATGANSVAATVVFVEKGGQTSRESYRFVVGTSGGRQVIESFSRG